ncbi:hypothetical protein PSTT_16222 [Puccinia striiformis]|uniref:Uncharacterized protein n=2 Tax=Puccinia striiformis TaxID=27350 RepID=A0A2S4UE53_9BASI|nr:hypothetical protein PSTT_16222 [Puccinia striiformis]
MLNHCVTDRLLEQFDVTPDQKFVAGQARGGPACRDHQLKDSARSDHPIYSPSLNQYNSYTMHLLTSVVVLLAARGISATFDCAQDIINGFCGHKQVEQGGDGNWYLTPLKNTGVKGRYPNCYHPPSDAEVCGDDILAARAAELASTNKGIPEDGEFYRHGQMRKIA